MFLPGFSTDDEQWAAAAAAQQDPRLLESSGSDSDWDPGLRSVSGVLDVYAKIADFGVAILDVLVLQHIPKDHPKLAPIDDEDDSSEDSFSTSSSMLERRASFELDSPPEDVYEEEDADELQNFYQDAEAQQEQLKQVQQGGALVLPLPSPSALQDQEVLLMNKGGNNYCEVNDGVKKSVQHSRDRDGLEEEAVKNGQESIFSKKSSPRESQAEAENNSAVQELADVESVSALQEASFLVEDEEGETTPHNGVATSSLAANVDETEELSPVTIRQSVLQQEEVLGEAELQASAPRESLERNNEMKPSDENDASRNQMLAEEGARKSRVLTAGAVFARTLLEKRARSRSAGGFSPKYGYMTSYPHGTDEHHQLREYNFTLNDTAPSAIITHQAGGRSHRSRADSNSQVLRTKGRSLSLDLYNAAGPSSRTKVTCRRGNKGAARSSMIADNHAGSKTTSNHQLSKTEKSNRSSPQQPPVLVRENRNSPAVGQKSSSTSPLRTKKPHAKKSWCPYLLCCCCPSVISRVCDSVAAGIGNRVAAMRGAVLGGVCDFFLPLRHRPLRDRAPIFVCSSLLGIIQTAAQIGLLGPIGLPFQTVYTLTCISYYQAVVTPPGFIPESWWIVGPGVTFERKRKNGDYRYCTMERVYKPDRAHYCRTQQRNVLRMDHYCGFLNNTIGIRNHKLFMLFLTYASSLSAWTAYQLLTRGPGLLALATTGAAGATTSAVVISPGGLLFHVGTTGIATMVSFGALPFCVFTMCLAVRNQTTIEFVEGSRVLTRRLAVWEAPLEVIAQSSKSPFGAGSIVQKEFLRTQQVQLNTPASSALALAATPASAVLVPPMLVNKGDEAAQFSDFLTPKQKINGTSAASELRPDNCSNSRVEVEEEDSLMNTSRTVFEDSTPAVTSQSLLDLDNTTAPLLADITSISQQPWGGSPGASGVEKQAAASNMLAKSSMPSTQDVVVLTEPTAPAPYAVHPRRAAPGRQATFLCDAPYGGFSAFHNLKLLFGPSYWAWLLPVEPYNGDIAPSAGTYFPVHPSKVQKRIRAE
ncbi:unnamed protein product [Amoebophrya sp. A120]|nr:unnamed protein product [Amoebophrya sp. A120]|eukprot:GSA120T00002232001.1